MENHIFSTVKDRSLVEKRRTQIIKSAIHLFKEKGFHRTTTREIAQQCGFSIGTLYEYVRTKEDVLFLVYQSINDKVYLHIKEIINIDEPSLENVIETIDSYYRLMDEMQDEVIILYQEIKSLHARMREDVLQQERDMVELFKTAIYMSEKQLVTMEEAELIANNILIQGQMWAFRRWDIQKKFTIDTYIQMQVALFYRMIGHNMMDRGRKDGGGK